MFALLSDQPQLVQVHPDIVPDDVGEKGWVVVETNRGQAEHAWRRPHAAAATNRLAVRKFGSANTRVHRIIVPEHFSRRHASKKGSFKFLDFTSKTAMKSRCQVYSSLAR